MIWRRAMFVLKGKISAVTTPYNWYKPYRKAVLETDWENIQEQLDAAESAMQERQRELSQDPDGTPAEKQALFVALNGIKCLRRDVSHWQHCHGNSDAARSQNSASA